MLDRTECDICKNKTFHLFEHYPRWPELNIVQCVHCGHVFTKQIRDKEEYETFYTDYHRKIADYHQDFNYNDTAKYKQKYPLFKQILNSVSPYLATEKTPKILDIGCYLGSFLDFVQNHGFQTYGCELDEKYVHYVQAKGHTCYHGTIEQLDLPVAHFDVIVLQEVFEHVPYPSELLDALYGLLKPGGLLVIEVPNMKFHYWKGKIEKTYFWKALTGRSEVGLAPHHHLNHFTVSTLNFLLAQKGFAVVKVEMRKSRTVADRHSLLAENILYGWNNFSNILYKLSGAALGNAILMTARKNNE